MPRTLIGLNQGWALPLDRSHLEQLGIDPTTPLEVRVEAGALVVRAAPPERSQRERHLARVQVVTQQVMEGHAAAFRMLLG